MNNNDLRAKIQDVLDQREQNRTEYTGADDALAFCKIKQILAATHLEEFLDTLLDYKLKGYTYLKKIQFYNRQIHVTLQNAIDDYTFSNDYNLQANESFSEITKQIVDIFYSHENNDE